MNEKKKVLVTGGTGFLGKHLCENLRKREYEIITFTRKEYDITRERDVESLFQNKGHIDFVVHAAALVGGIGFNKENPGRIYYDNIMMNTLIQEYARRHNVTKFLGIGSVCSYPKITPVPFREESLWEGYPEETNAPYGLSKRSLLVQSQSYRQQYGFNAIHLVMVNLYGPYDNFNLETSHVIPAMIRRIIEAKERGEQKIRLWGTGNASREFLYAEDAAEGIVLALENYDGKDPINLGSGMEISIRALAEKVSSLIGFEGDIVWDATKPDGQPRRCLDVSKAKSAFNFTAKTSLDEGLKKTIDWYRSSMSS